MIGPTEIVIVLLIVVVFFGAKKLPELGKGLGSGMREFKDGIQGKDDAPTITPPAPTSAPTTQVPAEPAEQPATPRTED